MPASMQAWSRSPTASAEWRNACLRLGEKLEHDGRTLLSQSVGLGMQTVKQIMEMHSGGVDIKSTPGEGTSVTLWLPIEEQQIAHAEDAA